MIPKTKSQNWRAFFVRIILPTVLAIILFVVSIFLIIIPTLEKNMIECKREMIRELTNSAWSIIAKFEEQEKKGILTRAEAQARAVFYIQYLRYGEEVKDYFWISDMHPRMLMHPYLPDLNDKDLTGFKDLSGKNLFVEFVNTVKTSGSGYATYMWQWKDDPSKIVPKLSYVKGFKPWGWIVGTGIYIEDVKQEIALTTSRLVKTAITITVIIAFLLLYITQQSLKIEKERREKEEKLFESNEKYKALVEAATEGIIMVLEGSYVYSNKIMSDMLGYEGDEFPRINILDIVSGDQTEENLGYKYFKDTIDGKNAPLKFETKLRKKDGQQIDAEVKTSKIVFAGKDGFIIIAKDISSHKQIEVELDASKEKYETLTNNINVGVFRSTIGRDCKFIEANSAALKIFGFKSKEELFETDIKSLFYDAEEKKKIVDVLLAEGFVKNKILKLKKADGTSPTLSVSIVLVRDENNVAKYCDGFVEDITMQKKLEKEREDLIVELQTSLLFLNQPIKDSAAGLVAYDMNLPIKTVAKLMTKNNSNSALVKNDKNEYIGIITDLDIRERAVAEGMDLNKPISEIMSAPLITISADAMIFEAIQLMMGKRVRHLVVKDNYGKIVSVVGANELLEHQKYPLASLMIEINKSETPPEIFGIRDRLPRLIKALIDSGADSKNLTRVIATVSESILNKLISFALKESGPPPARFVFMLMGSVGRREQTLKTDQDNAIIFEDVPEESKKEVREYFLNLGKKVCGWLDQAGYDYCIGDVMAQNPKWCQPLSVWKKYFKDWVNSAEPEDLLDTSIFFDFRGGYGDLNLTDELRKYLNEILKGKAVFFLHLAHNSLLFKPPIGFFRNIVVESTGEHRETFNIKKAMTPIVDFARIYALLNNVEKTNTMERLLQLFEKGVLNSSDYNEISQAYKYLMQMRLRHQAMALKYNKKPDNHINPKRLTHIEGKMLKETLLQISNFQSKLSFDFQGMK
jgi:PAS domain S-box-containing protein